MCNTDLFSLQPPTVVRPVVNAMPRAVTSMGRGPRKRGQPWLVGSPSVCSPWGPLKPWPCLYKIATHNEVKRDKKREKRWFQKSFTFFPSCTQGTWTFKDTQRSLQKCRQLSVSKPIAASELQYHTALRLPFLTSVFVCERDTHRKRKRVGEGAKEEILPPPRWDMRRIVFYACWRAFLSSRHKKAAAACYLK